MAARNQQLITVVGNLTSDSVLRTTQSGLSVTNNSIAASERIRDKDSGEWKDGDTTYFPFTLWGKAAENFVESAKNKGRVIAIGRVKPDSYEKDGVEHKTFKLEVDEIAFSTEYATLVVTKNVKAATAAQEAAAPAVAVAPAVAPAAAAPAVAPVAAPAAAPAAAPVPAAAASDVDFS